MSDVPSQSVNSEPPPKPLSEEDVNRAIAKLSTLSVKEINDICDGYARQLKGLITYVRKSLNPKTDEDDIIEIDRIMRIVNMCPKDDLFIRSKDKIWHARNHILSKDAKWFLDRDYSGLIKKDHKQRMIETIIKMTRSRYLQLTDSERDFYWEKAFEMLRLVATFKKLTNEA